MKIIICLDKNNGYMFFGKRLSQDKALIEKLHTTVGNDVVQVSEYSRKYLDGFGLNLKEVETFTDDGWAFIEDLPIPEDIDEAILYYWNREYPSDKTFQLSDFGEFRCFRKDEFKGIGHRKITEKIYKRKDK